MRCRECPDYTKCVKESNLNIKRRKCKKAKTEYVKTNADRIRAMSDEELADFIDRCEMNDIDYAKTFCDLCNGQYECNQCRLDWLQQQAE